MSNGDHGMTTDAGNTYIWHPEYSGRSFESVERELMDTIRRDQATYHLTLENAEKEEYGAFQTVRDLEKRWSDYDFGWFDVEPNSLAQRISAFEQERERRQELIDWSTWRASAAPIPAASRVASATERQDWRENLSDDQRRKIASGLAVGVMLLGVLICVGLYMLIR